MNQKLFSKNKARLSSTKSGAGFTLMEIVVSTTIFVIVFMALLSLFNYTLKINRRGEALRQASQGMRNFVEFLVKEIRNGQLDYYVASGTNLEPAFSSTSPCKPPSSLGANTYYTQDNRIGLINTDGVQECIYYGKADGSYVDVLNPSPQTFSKSAGGSTLVLEKAGVSQPQILNTSNFTVDNLMFLIRPLKDPYTLTGGLAKFSPVVSIIIKFVTKLPTGEQVPIYYQTSVSTSQYDIPNQ